MIESALVFVSFSLLCVTYFGNRTEQRLRRQVRERDELIVLLRDKITELRSESEEWR